MASWRRRRQWRYWTFYSVTVFFKTTIIKSSQFFVSRNIFTFDNLLRQSFSRNFLKQFRSAAKETLSSASSTIWPLLKTWWRLCAAKSSTLNETPARLQLQPASVEPLQLFRSIRCYMSSTCFWNLDLSFANKELSKLCLSISAGTFEWNLVR